MMRREARTSGYESPRADVLGHVPLTARRVLDVGCSIGILGASIRERQGAEVIGVELDPTYADEARARLDAVTCADAASFFGDLPEEEQFDCIVFADVLEHLVDPWEVVRRAAEHVTPGGSVIVSIPNVLWFQNALRLVRLRRWPREDQGIFDRTHLRWFALSDVHELLSTNGLDVTATTFDYWEARPLIRPTLERLSRTRLAPFVAARHIVTGVRP